MPPSLEFKAFRAAPNKVRMVHDRLKNSRSNAKKCRVRLYLNTKPHMQVKLLDFHPTQPWLVYADKGQNFCVIDWSTQQAVTLPILPLSK